MVPSIRDLIRAGTSDDSGAKKHRETALTIGRHRGIVVRVPTGAWVLNGQRRPRTIGVVAAAHPTPKPSCADRRRTLWRLYWGTLTDNEQLLSFHHSFTVRSYLVSTLGRSLLEKSLAFSTFFLTLCI